MSETILLDFQQKPSGLSTLLKAFKNRNSRLNPDAPLPVITAFAENLRVNKSHLKAFNRICEIKDSSELQILYPFTLAYPYMMGILCRKELPFSLFRVLNTRNSIRQYKPVYTDDIVDIRCFNSGIRFVKNGFEIDIHSLLMTDNVPAWENTTTYLVRSRTHGKEDAASPSSIEPLDDAALIHSWYLKAEDRFRFARISGDTNGIHYVKLYAKSFGFQRDFAQPIRVAAKCVDSLSLDTIQYPVKLDFFLKGPVYYENTLELKGKSTGDACRFDLFCGTNTRPCISGLISGN